MNTNFTLGLQVTAIGMALVFLTLIIIMFAIILLDRVFRPKGARVVEAAPERTLAAAQAAPVFAPVVARVVADEQDEIAAIGLALAAALASRAVVAHAGAAIRLAAIPAMVLPWDKPRTADVVPQGDIVTVVSIDGGSPVWRSEGRLKAVERR